MKNLILLFCQLILAIKNVTITVLGPTLENVPDADSEKYIWHWQNIRQVMKKAILDSKMDEKYDIVLELIPGLTQNLPVF